MHRDWHFESARRFPHRIEARVVHMNQLARLYVLAQIQPKGLQNLDATRTGFVRSFDLVGLEFRIIRRRDLGVPRFRENEKAIRMWRVEYTDGFFQASTIAA